MNILESALLALIVILFFTLIFETIQYRKFILAHRALMGMGAGMQSGFDTVVEHLNRLTQENVELKEYSDMTDKEIAIVRTILDLHAEKLEMQSLQKLFNKLDKLKLAESE